MTRIVSYRLYSVVRVIQMLPLGQELQTNQKVEFCFIAGCACINDIRQFDATLVWNECNLENHVTRHGVSTLLPSAFVGGDL